MMSRGMLVFFLLFAYGRGELAWGIQPVVAIHDSELTRFLDSSNAPAISPTPIGVGTTGLQWWTKDWHYFVMPSALKEALTSDGTAFVTITDSNILGGSLLANGAPAYPIAISLASEAISDAEIAPLTNYVAAGGFLLVGSSAFTRNVDGSPRGGFAFGSQLGVQMVSSSLTNWASNSTLTKTMENRLVKLIPGGKLSWRLPASSEEISWGVSPSHSFLVPHDIWRIQAIDATVLAQGDSFPWLTIKRYGKGCFIYCAAMQPFLGHGGFAPSTYSYTILRQAIEWAFETNNLPLPKLSAWLP